MIRIERIPGVLASAYEKSVRMAIDRHYRPVAAEIAAHLSEGTILDLGTGPGILPIEIAKEASKLHIQALSMAGFAQAGQKARARSGGGNNRSNRF